MSWVYLAAPYSDPNPEVVKRRMEIYSRVDAKLVQDGYYTMSPLSKHWILQYEDLPGDWQFWQGYGTEMLAKCDIICVVCMPGWRESTGVQAELKMAYDRGMVVIFVNEQGERIYPDQEKQQ